MKPDLRIFLCLVCATMMLACQRQGTANANLDKDEEHDLVGLSASGYGKCKY